MNANAIAIFLGAARVVSARRQGNLQRARVWASDMPRFAAVADRAAPPPPTSPRPTFRVFSPHFCVFNRLFVTRASNLEGRTTERTPLGPAHSPTPLLPSPLLRAVSGPVAVFLSFPCLSLSLFLSVVSLPAISRQAAGAGAAAGAASGEGHKSLAVDDNRKYILFW